MKTIIYIRKSTDVEDKQVYSLEAQERILLELAKKQNLEVIKIYKESVSAKIPGRELFNNMMKDFQRKKAVNILTWKLDRLARNQLDSGLIMHLLQTEVIKKIITPHKIYYSDEPVYLMTMEFGVSNQFSRDLSVNVKRGNEEKLKQGGWPNKAPFGYLNDKATKSIVIDKEKSVYVKKIFEMYATGTESTNSIVEKLYKQGLRNNVGNKVGKGPVSRVLKETFYYGIIQQHGKYYPGNHKPIVSKELFDKVQSVFNSGNKPRRKVHNFTFTGILKCEKCGSSITAEKQKNYIYYHCTNGKGICDRKKYFLREELIEKKVIEKFKNFNLTKEIIDFMYRASLDKLKINNVYEESVVENIKNQISILNKKESKLLDIFLEGNIDKKVYDKKALDIKNEQVVMEKELQKVRKKPNLLKTIELAKKHFETFIGFKNKFNEVKIEEKKKLLKNILSNGVLKTNGINTSLIFEWKKPYNVIVKLPRTLESSVLLTHNIVNLWGSSPVRNLRVSTTTTNYSSGS